MRLATDTLVSLMVRDLTIVAKQHHELARSFRAMADTWRQVLDATVPDLLPSPVREKDVVACDKQPSLSFGSGALEDHD